MVRQWFVEAVAGASVVVTFIKTGATTVAAIVASVTVSAAVSAGSGFMVIYRATIHVYRAAVERVRWYARKTATRFTTKPDGGTKWKA